MITPYELPILVNSEVLFNQQYELIWVKSVDLDQLASDLDLYCFEECMSLSKSYLYIVLTRSNVVCA